MGKPPSKMQTSPTAHRTQIRNTEIKKHNICTAQETERQAAIRDTEFVDNKQDAKISVKKSALHMERAFSSGLIN